MGDDPDPPLDPAAGPGEQVLLDENALAEGHEYLEVANLSVSPDHSLVAFATDTTGRELYDLEFRSLAGADGATRGPDPAETVADTYYGLAWANDNATVFYTRVDDAMRPFQLWRHRLGTDPATDVMVLEEPDERFNLSVGRTKNRAFVVCLLQSTTCTEAWVLAADDPGGPARVVERRRPGVEYGVEHHRGPDGTGFFVILTNDEAEDFRLMVAPEAQPGRAHWHEVLAHRPGTRLDDVDVFDSWLAVSERLDGEPRVRVVALGAGAGRDRFDGLLGGSRLIEASEHPSTTWVGPNPEPSALTLRYEQTSLVAPRAVYDVDVVTGTVVLRKRQPVLGGYDPARYRTFRLWATAPDGTGVPISVVHRADLLADPRARPPPPRLPPLLACCTATAPTRSRSTRSSRPCVSRCSTAASSSPSPTCGAAASSAAAGTRTGKMASKPNTFSDFIACARHLVDAGYTEPDRLVARGGSAGGLLIGAVANQAPELFAGLVAEVPFVDSLTTMLDETLPLTVGEWEEWGNPEAEPDVYATMRSYSPYDNVAPSPRPVVFPRSWPRPGWRTPGSGTGSRPSGWPGCARPTPGPASCSRPNSGPVTAARRGATTPGGTKPWSTRSSSMWWAGRRDPRPAAGGRYGARVRVKGVW